MDTRHHSPTIFALLHERSHTIPTIPFADSRELLTHGWGNHGWLMERRWWWRWQRSPTSGGQSPSQQGAGVFDGGGDLLRFCKNYSVGLRLGSGLTYTRKGVRRRATRARVRPLAAAHGPLMAGSWSLPQLRQQHSWYPERKIINIRDRLTSKCRVCRSGSFSPRRWLEALISNSRRISSVGFIFLSFSRFPANK